MHWAVPRVLPWPLSVLALHSVRAPLREDVLLRLPDTLCLGKNIVPKARAGLLFLL